jgi:GNAT superfamily N-acetyltransferase
MRYEPLGRAHDRAGFACTHPELELYLQQFALQQARRRIAATTVMVEDESPRIIGYHTLSATRLNLGALPSAVRRKLPGYAEGVPATLLGRLAVDQRFERRGFGRAILMNALERALDVTAVVASAFVIVQAIDDDAVGFYRKYGFIPLPDDRGRLFLPMRTIAELFIR